MRRSVRTGLVAMMALSAGALGGCADRTLGHVEPEVQHGFDVRLVQPGEMAVDLLVVVDDSQSMHQEQQNLAENFQHLVRTLTNPPDEDGDGVPDHEAVTDLHVGIVSTDMGVRGAPSVASCEDALDGDDGILISSPRTSESSDCAPSFPPFLAYDPAGTGADVMRTPEELDHAFGCLAMLGTDGCGYEQQLDAMVYFAAEYGFPRNVLGRRGFIDRLRLGIVDYDGVLLASAYDDALE